MDIQILEFVDGAKKATGLTVIIDVFRAFSVDCYVMNNGAEAIIPVETLDDAYGIKSEHPEYILIGERNEDIPPGFDYGNSPTHIQYVDFTGKTVIQTTSAGTKGLTNAHKASPLITGSFVNAQAIIDYILYHSPSVVSLVAMGYGGYIHTEEDFLCAQYIRDRLFFKNPDFNNIKNRIKTSSGKRFFEIQNQHKSPVTDFDLCLNLNVVDLIIQAQYDTRGRMFLSPLTSGTPK